MDRKTNIQVSVTTRDELASLGKKGQTYDDIVQMLIENFKRGQ